MFKENRKKIIGYGAVAISIVVILSAVAFQIIKYEVEGEKNMPFNVGKIIVISSAVIDNSDDLKEESEEEKYIWDERVFQNNDVYIYIDKNEQYAKDLTIRNVTIDNIKVEKKAEVGKIQVFMPNSIEGEKYKYVKDYLVPTSLTYTGSARDNSRNLEIGNQGGCVCISFTNTGLENYKSNDDTEIAQGAGILQKMNLTEQNLNFQVTFDLTIDVGNKAYKGTFTLDLPVDNLVGNKESHTEITDFKDVVFKRCKSN